MKNPERITVAFDAATADLLEKIKRETKLSQSEVMRRVLRFYNENRATLLSGEHVIFYVLHATRHMRILKK